MRRACRHRNKSVAHYFFDFRSGNTFSEDKDGVELPDAEAAHDMALGALGDAARDAVLEGSANLRLAIEVRNGIGRVLEVGAVYHSRIFQKQ
jgi:hypothetical protein